MKKIAVIDCGTNTFHLLIASYDGNEINSVHHEKQVVKIGKGGINNKLINDEACERALSTIKNFKKKIDDTGVTEIMATATSAFRNAQNGLVLRNQIFNETGVDIKIISGDDEAELIYTGVTSGLNLKEDTVLVMDIGGGSVEFIIGNKNELVWKKSYEIGAQRLLDLFHNSEPISNKSLNDLNDYLKDQLVDLLVAIKEYNPSILIGSSGTFDTISAIYCEKFDEDYVENDSVLPFEKEAFADIYNELITKNREERMAIPGMVEMRVDMIVVAVTIIDFILNSHAFRQIKISTHALKEGVLYKAVNIGL